MPSDVPSANQGPDEELPLSQEEQPDAQPDRQAQPVDAEEPPRLPFPVVGLGASAGGIQAITDFFQAMPADGGMAFVVVQHLPPERESMMIDIIGRQTKMPVRQVEDGMRVEPNHVYTIRPGRRLTIKDGVLHLHETLGHGAPDRPIDDFFKSLAEEQRERAISIILSGMGSNGTAGAQAVKAVGGLVIAQDPETCEYPSMPRQLIDSGYADYVLTPKDMPDVLRSYASHPYARGRRGGDLLRGRDEQYFREILTILRARTRQDFGGYKKPTILRRVHRRMGLARLTRLAEYAKLLRQSPTEVSALSDDLLIHVTGFFRDPEAWEVLRERVIAPLIASREPDSSVRAWVTACSTGEEAYTLAILLVEEAERVGKYLDIKVFATDMAERTLVQARNGIYPGGIEAEVDPSRLARFFEKEDAVYRVRQDLRERVVFAPQNVLQDPPFSRLDIVTCRNLLIYLEPAIQQRILALVHFGLREGGALFLGTSETVGGADDLFEVVDKKARIFRRIGPTRHGQVNFPLPRLARVPAPAGGEPPGGEPRPERRQTIRPSLAQMTQRALLEFHTPAAVLVDRDFRIVYFHGDTAPYLIHPRGEPTRDLMAMATDGVRAAARVALHRAAAENAPATVSDGWVDVAPGRRARVVVTASPAPADPREPSDFYVVSFEQREEAAGSIAEHAAAAAAAGGVKGAETADELRRVRDELQSAIEELQTSNEELKASNEEVTSMNEELQSTNEELETSKEELQSLNEELTTVNAQLQAKMEEHQATSNDLTSLLASTDIAVIFLDTRFRIRRFTPTAKELLQLIGADVGRPLSDLAPKFTDPDLLRDAQAVLDHLVPIEREIATDAGGWYLRRVTPYRTADNRIDGIVVTFINITERRRAAQALRDSEERFRVMVEGAREFAIFMLDPAGRITTWNAGAERVLGWTEDEAVGQSGTIIFTPEDRAAAVPERELENAARDGRAEDERWHVRKDGTRFWASGVMHVLRAPGEAGAGEVRGFVKVLRDQTQRKEIQEAATQAKEAAEQASRMKDEFLATLSHELRTPLSSILLWSKLLRGRQAVPPPQLAEGLEAIERSAEAQRALIEDLLDTSRITSGKLRLDLREVELSAAVREAVDAIRPTADAKGVEVEASLAVDAGIVLADPERLRQVVWNLLTNAVKFTPEGGEVRVTLLRTDGHVELRVADNGQGIAPEFLPHVFDPFRQADARSTRTQGGLGLGLSIVRRLVELHGGTVRAESAGAGQGAAFVVLLPLPDVRRRRGLATAPTAGAATGPAGADPLAGRSVLLVEDDAETRSAIVAALRGAGVDVTGVASAAAAVDALTRVRPDLIVSDIGLPNEDGYALIRRIRAAEADHADGRRTPAVALTAFVRDSDRHAAISAGYDRHLPKPVDPEKLLAALRSLLAAARLGGEQ